MAKADIQVIETLRAAIALLNKSDNYQWGHMGCCNCGFLAQVVTHHTPREIHSAAMGGHGDWSEQLNDYCPTSGYPMDELIAALLDVGFTREDLVRLERLSDPIILSRIPATERNLAYNYKQDVLTYLHAWVSLLEEQWVSQQPPVGVCNTVLSGQAEHEAILARVFLVDEPEPFFATFDAAET